MPHEQRPRVVELLAKMQSDDSLERRSLSTSEHQKRHLQLRVENRPQACCAARLCTLLRMLRFQENHLVQRGDASIQKLHRQTKTVTSSLALVRSAKGREAALNRRGHRRRCSMQMPVRMSTSRLEETRWQPVMSLADRQAQLQDELDHIQKTSENCHEVRWDKTD